MAGQWGVVIRDAGAAELPVLQEIDVATGQMFRDIGMPEVAEYDPWPLPDLEHSRAAGLLWVIPGDAGEPVAFLMGSQVDGCLHVEQLSVDMGSARRGLGRTLLEHAARRAAADGLPALTLTTFEHVAWNAPYYARLGFRILDDAEITPGCARSGGGRPRSAWTGGRGCACAATSRARAPDWGSPRVLPDGGFQGGQREPAVV